MGPQVSYYAPEILMEEDIHGPGIAADVGPHIFDPYFSTKAGGSGLGLPTVKRIIEELGGTLTFDTEPARGTSFRVFLKEAVPQPAATD